MYIRKNKKNKILKFGPANRVFYYNRESRENIILTTYKNSLSNYIRMDNSVRHMKMFETKLAFLILELILLYELMIQCSIYKYK